MNTYSKYVPNVFLAKCTEKHDKGEIIKVETKYGKEHECIVFNLIYEKDGFYFYSIVRADGFNDQARAKQKAEKLQNAASNSEKKSELKWKAADEGKEFLSLAEPIKIGHHSEKKHRALIERNHRRMDKAVELSKQAKEYERRADYWENRANIINLSMPESIEYYEFELEKAIALHQALKEYPEKRLHSFSLTYAKKTVNEMEKNLKIAKQLWG